MNYSITEFILKEVVWILLENHVLGYALAKSNRIARAESKIQLCWIQSGVQGPSAELA